MIYRPDKVPVPASGTRFLSLRPVWSDYHEIIEYDDEADETTDESYYNFSVEDGAGYFLNSKLYFFIVYELMQFDLDETTYYDNDEIMDKVPKILEEFKKIEEDEESKCKHSYNDMGILEYIEFSTFVKIENDYWFSLTLDDKNIAKHSTLLSLINNEDFLYKRVYRALKDYLGILKSKQKVIDDEWTEDFI